MRGQIIKRAVPRELLSDWTKILLTVLLLLTGSALLAGSTAGLVSLDHLTPFWPVALVACGLVKLLSEPDRKQS